MIAGLLRNANTNNINKAPFLGDLPILGALFRSTSFRRAETELVIIVTPYLVRPVSNQMALPTDGYRAPTDGRAGLGRPELTPACPARARPPALRAPAMTGAGADRRRQPRASSCDPPLQRKDATMRSQIRPPGSRRGAGRLPARPLTTSPIAASTAVNVPVVTPRRLCRSTWPLRTARCRRRKQAASTAGSARCTWLRRPHLCRWRLCRRRAATTSPGSPANMACWSATARR